MDGSISIIRAAQKGHIKLLQQLLVYKANIHAEIQTGDTALTLACENGHTKIVDLLLQHGANPVCFVFYNYAFVNFFSFLYTFKL